MIQENCWRDFKPTQSEYLQLKKQKKIIYKIYLDTRCNSMFYGVNALLKCLSELRK